MPRPAGRSKPRSRWRRPFAASGSRSNGPAPPRPGRARRLSASSPERSPSAASFATGFFVVWLALLLPSLVFLVIGGFPKTAGLQNAFTSAAAPLVLVPVLIVGLLWLGWQLLGLVRTLPIAAR